MFGHRPWPFTWSQIWIWTQLNLSEQENFTCNWLQKSNLCTLIKMLFCDHKIFMIQVCLIDNNFMWADTFISKEVPTLWLSAMPRQKCLHFCVTLKFDRWPWKTMEHLFCTMSNLCSISKPSVNSNWNYSLETLNLGQNWCLLSHVTLKNNRAPLLCYFKLYASFDSYQWIQTGVTVHKCPIQVKINFFLSCVTLKFDRWPWKTIGHLFYTTSSFVHHFVDIYVNSIWSYSSEMSNFGQNQGFFCPVWPWNLTDDLEKQ